MKRYNVVKQDDQINEEGLNEAEILIKQNKQVKSEQKKKEKDTFDRMEEIGGWIWLKFQALCWILGAVAIIYYSNFFLQLFHNEYIDQLFLTISFLGIGINIALSLYAAVVLPFCLKITEDLSTYNPRAIQVGAFSGFISFMTLVIAIWPVWGILSFPMVFTLFLGFLNTGHFLPNHQFSGIIFGGIFVGAFFSHHFIEHEGYWH